MSMGTLLPLTRSLPLATSPARGEVKWAHFTNPLPSRERVTAKRSGEGEWRMAKRE